MSVREIRFEPIDPDRLVRWTTDEKRERQVENELPESVLGAVDKNAVCETCKLKGHLCQGHFGHLRLAAPVFHHGFITRVGSVLKCIDDDGALDLRLRSNTKAARRNARDWVVGGSGGDAATSAVGDAGLTEWEMRYIRGRLASKPPHARLDLAVTFSKKQLTAKAKGCRLVRNKVHEVTPVEAHAAMSRISDEDAELLGFQGSRPEWLVLTVLPIPPPQVRPTAVLTGDHAQDDITKRLQEVVRANAKAITSSGAPPDLAALQSTIIGYLDHQKRPAVGNQRAQRGARQLTSLAPRIKGKEGRFRGTLMGKRTDFSGRSVITGDPHLRLDEVGVPPQVARVLTVPEVVGPANLAQLSQLLGKQLASAGPSGRCTRFYIWREGHRYSTRYTAGFRLQVGDVVERPLRDGDPVVFNRQPTLSKGSLLGFRARIMRFSTFRMPLAVTPSFNADFDGDEMNLFVPQTTEAAVEAATVMNAASNIVSAQGHRPQFGIVQDGLLGAYALTRRDVLLTRDDATSVVMAVPGAVLPAPAVLAPVPMWTGKQLASIALPPELDYCRRQTGETDLEADREDKVVRVVRGQLISGTLTKAVLGTGGGGLIHHVWKRLGGPAAARLIDLLQFVAIAYLTLHGFSIGIRDAVVPERLADVVRGDIGVAVRAAAKLGGGSEGVLLLEHAKERAGAASRAAMPRTNALHWMTDAGSKGSTINITQISACLGQQRVEGRLIPETYRGRTLPHYVRGSDDALVRGRGFVASNYLDGLAPDEMFFHAAGGREGLIDTAIKTSHTVSTTPALHQWRRTDLCLTWERRAGLLAAQAREELGERHRGVRPYGADVHREAGSVAVRRGRLGRPCPGTRPGHRLAFRRRMPAGLGARQPAVLSRPAPAAEMPAAAPDGGTRGHVRAGRQPDVEALGEDRERWCESRRHLDGRSVPARPREPGRAGRTRGDRRRTEHCRVAHSVDTEQVRPSLKCLPPSACLLVLARVADTVGGCSFHSAGTSSEHVTLGVPRLTELLNATPTIATPSMTLRVPHGQQDLQQHLQALTVGDLLVGDIRLVYDDAFALDAEQAMWTPEDEDVCMATPMDTEASVSTLMRDLFDEDDDGGSAEVMTLEPGPWVLRMEIRGCRFLKDDLDVHHALASSRELCKFVRLVHNAVRKGGPHTTWMGADLEEVCKLLKRIEKRTSRGDRMPWLVYVSGGCDIVHIRGMRGVERDVLWAAVPAVRATQVGGLPGVKACRLIPVLPARADGLHDYTLQTDGSDLATALTVPELHGRWHGLLSNDIQEVRRVLGVEAARAALLLECGRVLECDGNYVSARHLLLLVDMMTLEGRVASIGRTGVVKGITLPLGAATFEEPADILYKAAACHSTDDLVGPSQRVIFGGRGEYGTGTAHLELDELALPHEEVATRQPHASGPSAAGPARASARASGWAPATPVTLHTSSADAGERWAPASPVGGVW